MLPLEELKKALEHDKAQKAPPEAPSPSAVARAHLREAWRAVDHANLTLALEHFGDAMLDKVAALEAIDKATASLAAASRALTASQTEETSP